MSDRVLSTGTAKQSITRMQQIINGDLLEQINALNREGQILSDASVWDGQLAQQFRGSWPGTYQALMKAKTELEELRSNLQTINQNIMTAGGNV
jgi:uncharacterized protein YukE